MSKIIKFIKNNRLLLLVLILSTLTFVKMLSFGMFSTQDFHIFRLYEFDKCVKSLQIPCRWAPDAGLGYGEPIFNFYGQMSYAVGEIFHLVGLGLIDTVKLLFAISLLGSAVAMYFLAKNLWKNDSAALVSSILYIFAPYRAVDVWVRGAIPESLSFVLFPLILLSIEKKSVIWFTILFSLLILTHNLSVILFLPLLASWVVYRKFWKAIGALVISVLISAFYILPVVFESKFIDLASTTRGYFDFHNHFVTSYELFISNFWGYGASVWGSNDGLSLAVGYLQWIIPAAILIFLLLQKRLSRSKEFVLLLILGWFYMFLTHNKSTFFWENLKFMAYIQFPWRFLGMVVFCFSLASGYIVELFEKYGIYIALSLAVITVSLNFQFFRPDIWYKVSDSYYLTGTEWVRQRTASIGDFWPKFGHGIPDTPSDGKFINYFPGWNGTPDKNGLIPSAGAVFSDTPIRRTGNIISIIAIIGFVGIIFKKKWTEKV